MKIDIISDLHIDNWSLKYRNKFYKGKISECPFVINHSDAEYLIIAGDISDNINTSLEYINQISNNYKKILFIDGNHEHTENFPNLIDKYEINNMIKNDKLIYLSINPLIIEDTVFIGCCGWWDYNNKNEIDNYLNNNYYMSNFKLKFEEKKNLILNIIDKSEQDFLYLKENIDKFDNDDNIKNIIIITHTIPSNHFGSTYSYECIQNNFSTQYNSKFQNLHLSHKIKYWISGHNHGVHDKIIDNIHYISNPRGCPGDYNRINYEKKQIII